MPKLKAAAKPPHSALSPALAGNTTPTDLPEHNDHAAPKALMRVLRLLDVIAKAPEGLTLTKVSVQLGAPKSSLLLLLRALTAEGYLLNAQGNYSLGSQAYRLGSQLLTGRRLPKVFRPFMEELASSTQETALLGLLDREAGAVVYADVVESKQMVRYSVPAGTTRPLYASCSGRVLLAFQDEPWRRAYLRNIKLEAFTPLSITSKRALCAEIETIRSQGYGTTRNQAVLSVAAIAAPIRSAQGEVIAALSVGCPSDRFNSQEKMMSALLMDIAQRAQQIV